MNENEDTPGAGTATAGSAGQHKFKTCPFCEGQLEYPTQSDVECQNCGTVLHHEIRSDRHLLWDYAEDGTLREVVARA